MGIVIIGRFNGVSDGQTVKTESLYRALQQHGVAGIRYVDTYRVKRKPVRFFAELFISLCQNKHFIIMVSDKGRRVLFPILYYASLMGKKVYHYAIGGRLAQDIKRRPIWKRYVSAFCGNWMESVKLVEELHILGVQNAVYVPNFKRLRILDERELSCVYEVPFRFCTFSRVMEMKGIEDAIDAINAINREVNKHVASLDIYGPADDVYLDKLNRILKDSPCCRYCGVIPSDDSVRVVKDYYALLFPTHYRYEAIPGTIIDALSAGVPIIARKWQYCDEMIEDHVTGYIYDFEKPEELKNRIMYAIEHVHETINMKKNCIKKAREYSEEYVIRDIIERMRIDYM